MPIYEYRCEACGHALETLQKMSDAPLTECPHCGAPALKKQVSAAGFQLKGSGWYVTDFRDKGKKPDAKPDASASGAAKPAAESATKSESKAAAAQARRHRHEIKQPSKTFWRVYADL